MQPGTAVEPGTLLIRMTNPDVELQMRGERFRARATLLGDEEKEKVWDEIRGIIPMIHVYEKRTHRNIRVFRLVRTDNGS